jgi:hypothetical protein
VHRHPPTRHRRPEPDHTSSGSIGGPPRNPRSQHQRSAGLVGPTASRRAADRVPGSGPAPPTRIQQRSAPTQTTPTSSRYSRPPGHQVRAPGPPGRHDAHSPRAQSASAGGPARLACGAARRHGLSTLRTEMQRRTAISAVVNRSPSVSSTWASRAVTPAHPTGGLHRSRGRDHAVQPATRGNQKTGCTRSA